MKKNKWVVLAALVFVLAISTVVASAWTYQKGDLEEYRSSNIFLRDVKEADMYTNNVARNGTAFGREADKNINSGILNNGAPGSGTGNNWEPVFDENDKVKNAECGIAWESGQNIDSIVVYWANGPYYHWANKDASGVTAYDNPGSSYEDGWIPYTVEYTTENVTLTKRSEGDTVDNAGSWIDSSSGWTALNNYSVETIKGSGHVDWIKIPGGITGVKAVRIKYNTVKDDSCNKTNYDDLYEIEVYAQGEDYIDGSKVRSGEFDHYKNRVNNAFSYLNGNADFAISAENLAKLQQVSATLNNVVSTYSGNLTLTQYSAFVTAEEGALTSAKNDGESAIASVTLTSAGEEKTVDNALYGGIMYYGIYNHSPRNGNDCKGLSPFTFTDGDTTGANNNMWSPYWNLSTDTNKFPSATYIKLQSPADLNNLTIYTNNGFYDDPEKNDDPLDHAFTVSYLTSTQIAGLDLTGGYDSYAAITSWNPMCKSEDNGAARNDVGGTGVYEFSFATKQDVAVIMIQPTAAAATGSSTLALANLQIFEVETYSRDIQGFTNGSDMRFVATSVSAADITKNITAVCKLSVDGVLKTENVTINYAYESVQLGDNTLTKDSFDNGEDDYVIGVLFKNLTAGDSVVSVEFVIED